DITTLGRGGSDTTAVALAAALKAEVCEIYSDVDGVYSADPRLVPQARQLPHVSYEEMLELAASGAKILHLRSVEYARRYNVPLHVRSSFSAHEGTWIRSITKEEAVEQAIIAGVAHDTSEAKVTVVGVPDKPGVGAGMKSHPGVTAAYFEALSEAGVNAEMISTSEIRISVVCRADVVKDAVTALHTAFNLDADSEEAVVYGGTGR